MLPTGTVKIRVVSLTALILTLCSGFLLRADGRPDQGADPGGAPGHRQQQECQRHLHEGRALTI